MKSGSNTGAIIAVVVLVGLGWLMFSNMSAKDAQVFGVNLAPEDTKAPRYAQNQVGVHAGHDHGNQTPEQKREHEAEIDKAKADLFNVAEGKYTAADIAANGKVFPSDKFASIIQRHDLKPKSGDKICPVSETRANPAITWQVDGKSMSFCCSSCVEEYVIWAKQAPFKLVDAQQVEK